MLRKTIGVFFLLISIAIAPQALCEEVTAGLIKITSINSTLVMSGVINQRPPLVLLDATVKFTVKNISSSDIKVILLMKSINLHDDLNQTLLNGSYGRIKSSGIMLSSSYSDENSVFVQDKSKFLALSPNQSIQIFISPDHDSDRTRVVDPSGDFIKTHRPTSTLLNGAIGIINPDGSTEIRAFTLPNIPVSVYVR